MLTILKLFGRSPFAPLQTHMEKVMRCVVKLNELFEALSLKDRTKMAELFEEISQLEHQADLVKNDIRNNLPKTLYLPIDRAHLLEILGLQDSIADMAEDVAVLLSLKEMELPPALKVEFDAFLAKNIDCFNGACAIIKELHELLESSFGGHEAEKVREMVDKVAYKEHEGDLLQRKLLKKLIALENEMSYTSYDLWLKIFAAIAMISNLSEKLANRVRMTLDIK